VTIQTVAVLGAGAMGPDIWLSAALAGYDARLWARRHDALSEAKSRANRNLDRLVGDGFLTQEEAAAVRRRTDVQPDFARATRSVNLIIEAITENLPAKQALLTAAEAHTAEDTILASTTSSLSATSLASTLRQPARYLNVHYAQPAHLMPLVEVVPGAATAPNVVERTCAWLRSSSKIPVIVKDVPGFVWTRLQMAVLRECVSLIRNGVAGPADIDRILKYGYAVRLPVMGALEHADLAGLDLIQTICSGVWPALDNAHDPVRGPIGDLVLRGHLGMKSGVGFYDWRARDSQAFRDARDEEIVRRLKVLGWRPREWQPQTEERAAAGEDRATQHGEPA